MLRTIIFGVVFALSSLGANAEPYKMTLSGASPSGLWP